MGCTWTWFLISWLFETNVSDVMDGVFVVVDDRGRKP